MRNRFHWILDNGHGHNTPGKRSPVWSDGTQLFEYEYNRAVVAMLSTALDTYGIAHTILVPELHDVSLRDRVIRANTLKVVEPKVVVSVHGNAAGVERASGFEVFTSKGETSSDRLATVFAMMLQDEFPLHKHRHDYSDGDPDKESQFYILRKTRCAAILTENGFFTNQEECRKMMEIDFRKRVALAHLRAILQIENV